MRDLSKEEKLSFLIKDYREELSSLVDTKEVLFITITDDFSFLRNSAIFKIDRNHKEDFKNEIKQKLIAVRDEIVECYKVELQRLENELKDLRK